MSERILFALNDLPNDLLAECEAALAAGSLPEKKPSRLSRFLEPLGYVAMLVLVLGVIIVAPDLLRKKPVVSPSDTTETAETYETEETEETEETAPVTDEEPSSVDRNLASYMSYLPNYFYKTLEIHDGTVFREDVSDLLVAFCCLEREWLDIVSYEDAEGVGVVTVKRDDLQKVGELLLGETFDLADYRGYWGDPSSNAISRYDEAADCFTVEVNSDYWGGEPYYPVFGAEPEYRYDGNTVTVTVPISYQNDYYEGQRITFSYRFEKVESDGMLVYRLKSVTAVPPTTLAPLTAAWNGKTVTVKYDVIADIAYPDDMGYIYFCNGYAIFFDYGEDPDNLTFSEEGDVWGCMDIHGNRLFSFVCDGITNFDENGVAVAAFHTSDAGKTEYHFINTKGEKVGTATKEDFNAWWSQYEIDVLPPEAIGLTVNPAYEESGEGFPCYFGERGVWEYGSVWNGLVFMHFDDEGIVLMDTEGNTVLTTDYSFSPTHLGGFLLSEGRLITEWNGYLAILTVTVTGSETTAPDFDETRVAFYPDGPSMDFDELIGGLKATACPAEDLPAVGAELTREELEELMPFFRDMTAHEILSADPFYRPEQIDLGWLLYCQNEFAELSGRELEQVKALYWGDSDDPDNEPFFKGNKLTTAELEAILTEYLGVRLTPRMLQELKNGARYLAEYDAYYAFHTDFNLADLVILQGWKTEDGGYLVRFWQDEEGLYGDYTVLLKPVGDSFHVKQMLRLGSEPDIWEGEYLERISYVLNGETVTLEGDEARRIYGDGLSLPLTKSDASFSLDDIEHYVVTLHYKNGTTAKVVSTYDHIRIDSVWYKVGAAQYGLLKNELGLSFPLTDPPDAGNAEADLSLPPLTESELYEALKAAGCPEDQLPKVTGSLSLGEIEALLPFFRDLDVQSVLSGDPFYRPEQINLADLLYYQYPLTPITAEEEEALYGNENERFVGTRLTTEEYRTILKNYLDVELTDAMLENQMNDPYKDIRYLEDFDAYYVAHDDYYVMTPILLQGWMTGDGGYLVRFWNVNGEVAWQEADQFVLLSPKDGSYLIQQLLTAERSL